MRNTHQLIMDDTHVTALGIGNYFSWLLIPEYGEWEVCSIYGQFYKSFKKFTEALDFIDYGEEPLYDRTTGEFI